MPTAIEWCDETFNPWWGCAEVSPGCAHCYARTWANFTKAKLNLWPEHGDPSPEHGIMVTSDANWREPLKWARDLPAQLGRRPRVFCASMADVFEELPQLDEHRRRLFDVIERTPELDWLLLTKRPEFARDWLTSGYISHAGSRMVLRWPPLPNVWVGVSIENARFTWRADVLREIPAAVRFISAEPLLGSLFDVAPRGRSPQGHSSGSALRAAALGENGATPSVGDLPGRAALDLTDIDWVIVGGESGGGARPFHLEHAREIIRAARAVPCAGDMCTGCDVDGNCHYAVRPGTPAVFVKQLGAKPLLEHVYTNGRPMPLKLADRKGGDWDEWPADLRIREFPASPVVVA